jgi:formylglycine-generating enzyme required for sulfatase activity
MKTPFSKSLRCLGPLYLAVWALGPQSLAQTPPALSIQLYAGLSITGAVGAVYQIQYATDLAQTDTPTAWRCLEFLQLPTNPWLWTDKSAPATGRRFYRAVAFSAPTNMVFIPPGTFRMGSPLDEVGREFEEGPQTAVTISQGFWMGKYKVTQGEYQAVMGSNPSFFNGVRQDWPVDDVDTDFGVDLARPVDTVSWFDATNYCAALTQRERAAGRIATNSVYRLPTEAEWEYACRAWTSDRRFSYGDDPGYTNLANYGWFGANSDRKTHRVGQKLPNPWGLYDMYGNVLEWCQDWYGPYPGGIAVDPQGFDAGYARRVIRGSYWDEYDGGSCRSAYRESSLPAGSYYDFGFRVVLASGQP